MSQRFSTRTAWNLEESSYAKAIREARSSGRELLDLTIANPTACGFHYDLERILSPLSDLRSLSYDPDPRGILTAREAVASYYREHGATIVPAAINLTTSTSEAYAYLFRLLCNTADEILVPQPSYPLFNYLADLEDVRLTPYSLFYDYGWWIDFDHLERQITPRTRAILLVHPNNPTGHATRQEERDRLEELCVRHNLALIVDEVFLDFPHRQAPLETFACGPHPALTFVLSGMSKIAGLPQMKVGWIATLGPEELTQEALGRLEVIADTFLSLNTPAQLALPHWLASRYEIQNEIVTRINANLQALDANGIEHLISDGGWSAVLRLPRTGLEAEDLLKTTSVMTHPGNFYAIAERGRTVVSLITPESLFSTGIALIAKVANSSV